MNSLARAKHPKIILGVVGAAIAVPVLGITMSLVGASANTQQEVSMQENAQGTVSLQQETVPTVASAVVVAESQPAQSPLPDPLAPEATRDSVPSVSASLSAAQEPASEPEATATAPKVEKVTQPVVTEQVVNEPKTVKKTTQVAGGWTAPC